MSQDTPATRQATRSERQRARDLQKSTGLSYAEALRQIRTHNAPDWTVTAGRATTTGEPARIIITGPRNAGQTANAVNAATEIATIADGVVIVTTVHPYRFMHLNPTVVATFKDAQDVVKPGMVLVTGLGHASDEDEMVTTLAALDGVHVIATRADWFMKDKPTEALAAWRAAGWDVRELERAEARRTGPFFQHMSTTDPAVLAAIRGDESDREAFATLANNLAVELGGVAPVINQSFGQLCMVGIAATEKPKGRWAALKKVRDLHNLGMSAWRPYENSPADKALDRITVQPIDVPGLPAHFDGTDGRGQQYWLNPQLFIDGDTAYMSLSMAPDKEQSSVRGDGGWQECLASEVDAALERFRTTN